MTTTPAWHQDPYDGTRLRWHDGSAWTMHTAPGGRPVSTRPALGGGWFALATLLQVSLGVCLLIDLVGAAVAAWSEHVLDGWLVDPSTASVETGRAIDRLMLATTVAQWLGFVVTGVLFITWLYRAHRSNRMDPAFLQHGSGWAIGGWFVPVLSLWRPLQVVRDVCLGAVRDRPSPGTGITGWWWAAFLASLVTARLSWAVVPDADVDGLELIRGLRTAAVVDAVYFVVLTVTAILAILLVRRVTALVRDAQPV